MTITADYLRAEIAAGRVPVLPIKTAEVRAILAGVMREMMDARTITVAEAARLCGLRDDKLAYEIAKAHGLRSSAAAMAAHAARGRAAAMAYVARHDGDIARLRSEGLLRGEIAERLGLTLDQVRRGLHRLGLTGVPVSADPRARKPDEHKAAALAALKRDISGGMSVDAAAARQRITPNAAIGMLFRAGVKISSLRPKLPAQPRKPVAKAARTPAQQANAEKAKTAMYAPRSLRMAPPSREEADRAVAEWLKTHSVTVCPAAAKVVGPCNAGVMWGER